MRSSKAAPLALALVLCGAGAALGQPPPPPSVTPGFALDRFVPSAAGAGWWTLDDLAIPDWLHGALGMSVGYAYRPLVIRNGADELPVVTHDASLRIGAAFSHHRIRLSLDFRSPLVTSGQSGQVGPYPFQAPDVDLGSHPDTLSDLGLGIDARLYGRADGRLRLGLGARLLIPTGGGAREHYDSDEAVRGLLRLLAAGDRGRLLWAAELGVHLRALSLPAPETPKGHELRFGVAVGARLTPRRAWQLLLGPELFGATPFAALFGSSTTAFEALLSGRLETPVHGRLRLRTRLGVGGGLYPHFGAPTLRLLLGVELYGTP